ncbi:uncharacterized protein VP01_3029g3 [Puccinia sorghi]|uniref:DDE Tnp4 domain-containing protein n=1 Tax=Puccinia sorghi TaxID=27349 RepID=A0A0L6V0V0_9BASI|nr:uncharacterized protein VP01_3029g3 [Puccinia sorghi]
MVQVLISAPVLKPEDLEHLQKPHINTAPSFKRKKKKDLNEKRHHLNRHLSGVQVIIENCIAILKDRFQGLKGLRLQLLRKKD